MSPLSEEGVTVAVAATCDWTFSSIYKQLRATLQFDTCKDSRTSSFLTPSDWTFCLPAAGRFPTDPQRPMDSTELSMCVSCMDNGKDNFNEEV